jgi:hypothetical protein
MRLTALIILVALAGGGVAGGILLLMSPDGAALGLSVSILPSWYTGDFLPAGILLLLVFGVAPIAAIVLLFARPRSGWSAVVLIGVALLAWMIVQIGMIGLTLPPMQIAFIVIGAALVMLGGRGFVSARYPRSRPKGPVGANG